MASAYLRRKAFLELLHIGSLGRDPARFDAFNEIPSLVTVQERLVDRYELQLRPLGAHTVFTLCSRTANEARSLFRWDVLEYLNQQAELNVGA